MCIFHSILAGISFRQNLFCDISYLLNGRKGFFSRWLVSREQAKASELVQACWKTAGTLRELSLWIGGLRQSPKKVKCLPQNKVMLHFQKTYPSKMWIKYFEVLENPPQIVLGHDLYHINYTACGMFIRNQLKMQTVWDLRTKIRTK